MLPNRTSSHKSHVSLGDHWTAWQEKFIQIATADGVRQLLAAELPGKLQLLLQQPAY